MILVERKNGATVFNDFDAAIAHLGPMVRQLHKTISRVERKIRDDQAAMKMRRIGQMLKREMEGLNNG